ncbi:27108_t:CDS:2 [Gigaspora margarita]|uniref:Sulfhydryl oxidase n=1 Tax=Gigaspora margarita TaxID=4874 RepID=A0ABN7ULA6_GIGMA|nr:27108_t:CDS:2 [Gigaspora margarita]
MINERLLPDFIEQVNNSVPEIPKIPEISFEVIHGPVVMPELKNDTIKIHLTLIKNQTCDRAELGRGTWKLLHTMMARFPENPTTSEKEALRNFLHLFSRLYPCAEFQEILKKYPPQVSSREAASQWACAIHNMVNVRLKKEIFDCGSATDSNSNKDDSTTDSNEDDFDFDSYE